jgi:multiple sugar transport system permease protein
LIDILLGGTVVAGFLLAATRQAARLARTLSFGGRAGGWVLAVLLIAMAGVVVLLGVLPWLLAVLDVGVAKVLGMTIQHYRAVWVGHGFWRNFANSMTVTAGVVTVSLTVGTLAGYALSRVQSGLGLWLLLVALVFRALPHSVLVTGFLPVFIGSRDLLMPLWEAPVLGSILHLFADAPPTLYGKPWAVIAVLVSINQPFTIWLLRSFFRNVPTELDEAARVDGCSHLEAFLRVIVPVMWPGVITAGLFSFLLAYNDYLVCALLLDAQSQTMVPAITQYFNRETTSTDQVEAVAAAVSITAPLFVLVMAFQRQIVSGLTAGAVKG